MGEAKQWFWVGSRPEVLEALTTVMGGGPTDADLDDAQDGDLVVVDPLADSAAQAGSLH